VTEGRARREGEISVRLAFSFSIGKPREDLIEAGSVSAFPVTNTHTRAVVHCDEGTRFKEGRDKS
jgi:hypothetical protein